MYTFEANYDEEGAAEAERFFYVRSIIELRRWLTFGPPLFLVVVVLVGLALGAPAWFTIPFSSVLALSIISPLAFYFLRPRSARRLARMYPNRQISLTPTAIEISVDGQKSILVWKRIKHVWNSGNYLVLVLGKFVSIGIPRHNLPLGAEEFINLSVKNAA